MVLLGTSPVKATLKSSSIRIFEFHFLRSPTLYSGVPHATHRETEVKLRVADIPALLRKLKSLKAANRGRVFERNTLYDTSDSAFRRSGCLLRLRTEMPARSKRSHPGPPQHVTTFKAPTRANSRSRYKERLESELALSKPDVWPQRLAALGLRPSFTYEKFRTSFRLPAVHLDLDETPVGTFLEIEASANSIDRIAKALGYAPHDYFSGTYWDVYAADCRRRGLPIKNMVFNRKKLRK